MQQRHVALAVATALALGGLASATAVTVPAARGRAAQAGSPGGSTPGTGSGILALRNGTIWATTGPGDIRRSTDGGGRWRTVLEAPSGVDSLGVVATWFRGPQDAWVAEERAGLGPPHLTVLRTSDGGRRWAATRLPTGAVAPASVLFASLDFAGRRDGWLIGATTVSPRVHLAWWATTDGGARWSEEPERDLPIRGISVPYISPCPRTGPALTFATLRTGWLSPGGCGEGHGPEVWRTADGGRTWSSAPLPPPPGGWGPWLVAGRGSIAGGLSVGPVERVAGELLVPVGRGAGELVVERSTNGGRTWRLAGRALTGAAPGAPRVAGFEALGRRDWVDAVPGGVLHTDDAGQTWSLVRSDRSLPDLAVSFTTPNRGWQQAGAGLATASSTTDSGRTWLTAPPPPGYRPPTGTVADEVNWLTATGRVLVAGGGTGVATSLDGGRRWQVRLGPTDPAEYVGVAGRAMVAVVTYDQLLVSTDAANTFHPWTVPLAGPVDAAEVWSNDAGVAQVDASLWATGDSGARWTRLRAPAGWSLSGELFAGSQGSACFGPGPEPGSSVGWAVARRGEQSQLLVTTDAGGHWKVALPPGDLPAGDLVSVAACSGERAVVEVSEPDGEGAMGVPRYSEDLLVGSDLGRRWLDVLRSSSVGRVARPRVAAVAGGPVVVPEQFQGEESVSLAGPSIWVLALDGSGSASLWSTADDGRHWSLASRPVGLPPLFDASIVARGRLPALLLAPAGKSDPVAGVYESSDGGKRWARISTLRLPDG